MSSLVSVAHMSPTTLLMPCNKEAAVVAVVAMLTPNGKMHHAAVPAVPLTPQCC